MKWRMTLSPWLTTIWSGANVNDLKSHAPTLLGSTILNPPPVGIVEFAGGTSAGCSGVFCALKGFATAACKLVAPSRCTVFIQNSLLVVLLGSTITGLLADSAVDPLVWAGAYCDICVPRIIAADANTAIIAAAAMIDFVFVFVFLL